MPEPSSDIIVIGAGMAGTAAAAHLAAHASVLILEMEDQPGYHATGRSAALFTETYGPEPIRALSRASRGPFFTPLDGFAQAPLVKPRSVMTFARSGQEAALDGASALSPALEVLEPATALLLCPMLRAEGLVGALLDRGPADIDVHELQQSYLRLFRGRGGRLAAGVRVEAIERDGQRWRVDAGQGRSFDAAIVVNAAGAWAGEIGRLAGGADIGLRPFRRTAALVDTPADASWPMIVDAEETFYAKPDAGRLLISPADESPSPPCDAAPEEIDIAIAVERLEQATTLEVRRVVRRWAGLRSFVADRSPVVGFDPVRPGFFWLAALGGYGIQTAPALSSVAASLVLGRPIDERIAESGVRASDLSPARI